MRDIKHIAWFTDFDKLNLDAEKDKSWWIKQVLLKGRMEDIQELDFNRVKKILPEMYLPKEIKKLWEDYFEWKEKGTIDGTPVGSH